MVHFKIVIPEGQYVALQTLRSSSVYNFLEMMYTRFNHTTELVLVDDDTSRKIKNTWTGIVGALIKGEADISFYAELYNAQIAEVLGMQYIFYKNSIGILAKEKFSESVGDIMRVFYEMEVKVWFLMALVILIITIFNKITMILISKVERKLNMSPDNNLLTLFGMMLYYGSSRSPKLFSSRILLQFYAFSTMIFVCYLYADMKTSGTVIRPKIYRTIQDLLADEQTTLVLLETVSTVKLFQNSQEDYPRFLERVSTPPGRIVQDFVKFTLEARQTYKLIKMNHVFVGEMSAMNIYTHAMCSFVNNDLVLVEYNLKGVFKYFLHKKNLEPEKRLHLRKVSRYMAESGLLYTWFDEKTGEIPRCARKSGEAREVEMESLMVGSLRSAIVFWATGLLSSGVCLIAEIGLVKFWPDFRVFRSCP